MDIDDLNKMHGFTTADVEKILWTTPNISADEIGSKLKEPVRLFLYRNKDLFKRNNDVNPLWSCIRTQVGRIKAYDDTYAAAQISATATQANGNRYAAAQISATATRDDVEQYEQMAKAHSVELRNFLKANKIQIPNELHLLDIGCGYGHANADFKKSGFRVSSYQGIDHSSEMRKEATKRYSSSEFHEDLTSIKPINGECLVLINHVFGQKAVDNEQVRNWSKNLKRICPKGFVLLNSEPHDYTPSQNNRSAFINYLTKSGFEYKEIIQKPFDNFMHKDFRFGRFSLK